MGVKVEAHTDPNSTPKLALSKLPYCKPREPPRHMPTPPLLPSVSIPFHWEEAPGKPRAAAEAVGAPPPSSKSKTARCLDLPPRLLHEDAKNITIMPSPTTVLDGPYVGRSLSLACTFSFRKGLVSGREDGLRPSKRNLGSGRWGSFREEERKCGRDSMDISQSLGDIFRSEDNNNNSVKITRVRRRKRSFFNLSTVNSKYLWADIYASFKQAVPWRRSP